MLDPHSLQNSPLLCRNRFELIFIPDQDRFDLCAPVMQMTRGGHSASTVVPVTAEDGYPFALYLSFHLTTRQLRKIASGIFHHLHQRDSPFFNHQTVHFDHLICRENWQVMECDSQTISSW